MKDVSKIGLAVLAGIMAGGVAALLFAPEEGAETRKKIGKKAKKLEKKFKEKAKEYSDKASEKAKEYSEKASEKAKEFKGKAEGYMNKASHAKDDVVKTAEGYI